MHFRDGGKREHFKLLTHSQHETYNNRKSHLFSFRIKKERATSPGLMACIWV